MSAGIVAPLVYYKQHISVYIYVVALLVLHVVVLVAYMYKVRRHEFAPNKMMLIFRIFGVLFCLALLSIITFAGSFWLICIQLLAATALHALILCIVMVQVELTALTSAKKAT